MEAILELSFAPAASAVTDARRKVTEWFGPRLAARVLEDVRLLVTELVTNALRHGSLRKGDRVSLKASLAGDVLRIEVRDPGRDGAPAQRAPGARGAGGGYGLYLVEKLARRWGVDRRDGMLVWCELASGSAR